MNRSGARSRSEEAGGLPRFEASDFDLPPLPKRDAFDDQPAGTSTPLSDLYGAGLKTSQRPNRNRRPAGRTRGRYERAATMLVLLDWIHFVGTLVAVGLAVAATVATSLQSSASAEDWQNVRLLGTIAVGSLGAYSAVYLTATAMLALLDIEEHLATRER